MNAMTGIVQEIEVMGRDAIAAEIWTAELLFDQLRTADLAMKWLAKRQLLKNSFLCERCNVRCSLHKYATGIDGVRWCCRLCHQRFSIRKGSFFSKSHLPLKSITYIIYHWSYNMPQQQIAHETGVSMNSIVDWCNFCREECATFFYRNPTQIGGIDDTGEPITVEIDESKFFHRKYHRGAIREGHWVFGGIERSSGKCFVVEVPNRTAETLEHYIQQHILPGTHIITDGWRAYANISTMCNGVYMHSSVIHEENFVDPHDSEIHTQNVENMWMRAKRKLKYQFGTSRPLFSSYLQEFQFRTIHQSSNPFAHFLLCLVGNYAA